MSGADVNRTLGAFLRARRDSADPIPIGVLGHDMKLLGWNRLAHAVFASFVDFDAPWSTPGGVNWARVLFCDPRCQSLFSNWDAVTIDVAGRIRTSLARDPGNPSVLHIIDELRRDSPRFATLWDWQPVRERPLGTVHIAHPTVGDLQLQDTVMRLSDADEQLVLVFQAEPGSSSEQRLHQLCRSISEPGQRQPTHDSRRLNGTLIADWRSPEESRPT